MAEDYAGTHLHFVHDMTVIWLPVSHVAKNSLRRIMQGRIRIPSIT